VWNAARFVMMITEPLTEEDFVSPVRSPASPGPVQSPAIPGAVEDRWILSQLARTIDDATRSLDTYEFDKVVGALYGFTWNSFCDWYLELIKRRVYDNSDTPAARESARAARVTAILVLEHICRLLHPVTPFATEEIWQTLRERLLGLAPGQPAPGRTPVGHAGLTDGFCAPSVCVASWPAAAPAALDLEAESQIGLLQEIVGAIRNIRGEMRVPLDAKVEVVVRHGEPGGLERCARLVDSVRPLASVGRMEVSNDAPAPGFSSTYVSGALTVLVALPPELVEQERVRLEKELAFAEKGLNALAGKLANPGFLGKAPADVVEKEREKLARLEADANALRDKLAALGQH
jgi:valyl-tRNA synthetase